MQSSSGERNGGGVGEMAGAGRGGEGKGEGESPRLKTGEFPSKPDLLRACRAKVQAGFQAKSCSGGTDILPAACPPGLLPGCSRGFWSCACSSGRRRRGTDCCCVSGRDCVAATGKTRLGAQGCSLSMRCQTTDSSLSNRGAQEIKK